MMSLNRFPSWSMVILLGAFASLAQSKPSEDRS